MMMALRPKSRRGHRPSLSPPSSGHTEIENSIISILLYLSDPFTIVEYSILKFKKMDSLGDVSEN
jgi:hypothetical protein